MPSLILPFIFLCIPNPADVHELPSESGRYPFEIKSHYACLHIPSGGQLTIPFAGIAYLSALVHGGRNMVAEIWGIKKPVEIKWYKMISTDVFLLQTYFSHLPAPTTWSNVFGPGLGSTPRADGRLRGSEWAARAGHP